MTSKEARRGAALAGAVLLSMPLIDALLATAAPGLVHLVVGSFGAMLIAVSGTWR